MKILFTIVDYLSAVFMGTGTVFLTGIIVGRDWNIVFAMFAGMAAGSGILVLSLLLFISVSTPFEIVPKGMVIIMVAGTASGMAAAVDGPGATLMLSASAVFSVFVQLGFDVYNVKLTGEVPLDKE